MRKLVTLRRIAALEPIPDADAIEVAVVDGWKVVVKKGEFVEGDIVLYFEIDSWVPHELAPFLSKGKEPREYLGVKGERLKTIKLRGQLSQGLVLPTVAAMEIAINNVGGLFEISYMDRLDEINASKVIFSRAPTLDELISQVNNIMTTPGIDEDGYWLSTILDVNKYEKPLPGQLVGKARGNFPSWIRKTDQERCQNMKRDIFEKNPNAQYEVTIKLDGSSMTAYARAEQIDRTDDGDLVDFIRTGVCSRNLDLLVEDDSTNSFVRLFIDSGLRDALKEIGTDIAVQGELMGPGIQGNRENLTDTKFFIFDIQANGPGDYLTPEDRYLFLESLYLHGVDRNKVVHAPVNERYGITLEEMGITDIAGLLAYAEGPSINNPVREGVVFKRVDGQFSFKAISNTFLLKGGD